MRRDLSELTALAARGLVQMFDPATNLFCARLVRTPNGLVRQDQSPRYTMMTLLGLREREKSGKQIPFDSQAIYRSFVRDTSWIKGVGDFGLLLWLTAEFDQDNLNALFEKFDPKHALSQFEDGQKRSTTELAWFLAGLSHAAQTSNSHASKLTDLAVQTFRLTQNNQRDSGFFGHLGTFNSMPGLVRGRIGSFADQVYPIYSFSKFAQAFHVDQALGSALKCARAICDAQGDLGQWWWLYDSASGRVSSRFPVYSVHQHAMAPMALFALERVSGTDFQPYISRGLDWIYGHNEISLDMRDLAHNVVWRCIRPSSKSVKYKDVLSSFFKAPTLAEPVRNLKVLYEDWPYELGWLLYAFSNNELRTVAENESTPVSAVNQLHT